MHSLTGVFVEQARVDIVMQNGWGSLLWFVVIVAMIPIVLWLLKRTPAGAMYVGGTSGRVMRIVATLPLSASQRIVTVEVGQGEERRWLVLGVTAQNITTLHTMTPQGEVAAGTTAPMTPPFAQLLRKLRRDGGERDGR